MADTNFVAHVTTILTSWLQDVNNLCYRQGAPFVPLAGGNLTGAVNSNQGSVAATATTTPLWVAANGNEQIWSNTPTITTFPNAPQAGASRVVYPAAGTIFTSAGSISVQGGSNYTVQTGDRVTIVAVTTTSFSVWVLPAASIGQSGKVAILNYQLPSGSAGAGITSGASVNQVINTTQYDGIGVTVSNPTFTLPAGTYLIEGVINGQGSNPSGMQSSIYNTTASTYLINGETATAFGSGGISQLSSTVTGVITVASSQALALRAYSSSVNTVFQNAISSGQPEVFATVKITKL